MVWCLMTVSNVPYAGFGGVAGPTRSLTDEPIHVTFFCYPLVFRGFVVSVVAREAFCMIRLCRIGLGFSVAVALRSFS